MHARLLLASIDEKPRACCFWIEPLSAVIASDSEAIQTKRRRNP
jgi:hypothetical protein